MINSSYKIDTETLICTIEKNRCIWDVSCEEYKNREIKNKAYRDVAAVVIKNFLGLSESEKSEAVQLIQKRWKTARDAYVRDRTKLKKSKSDDAAKSIKKYLYFDILRFLDSTMDLNRSESTCEVKSENCAEDFLETVLSQPENDEEIKTESNGQLVDNFTQQKRKKVETVDDELVRFLKKSEDGDRDHHEAFMVSLLPTLRTFSETQTLMFRSEVLRIVMELKNITPRPYFPSAYVSNSESPSTSRSNLLSPNSIK
ncbi:unnamed protein product [Brassicogethes aeneus]|uniref:MADF domain-containing protein n=1 Tax=Brassicogethes aeneus TaxID=1431903 RepID=A0A9P0FDK8_BRAAE|nr:unnamed protein product [Brassicogethes aeneus]